MLYIFSAQEKIKPMKKFLLPLALVAVFNVLWSQAPQLVNYQAVVRDVNGSPLANTNVNMRFQIHDGSPTGTIVFQETDAATTNQFGLVTIQVGSSQNLSVVNWGSGPKYLQPE